VTDKPPGSNTPSESNNDPHGSTEDDTGAVAPQQAEPPATPAERVWTKEVVLAFAGIAATVITAGVGAYFTYRASIEQANAARDQSSIEFQRDERKSAYSDLLAKTLVLEDAEQKVDTERYSKPIDEIDEKWLDELNKWQAASDQMSDSAAAADLVGSAPVRVKVLQLREAHSDVSNAYSDINLEYIRGPSNRQAIDAAIKEYQAKRSRAFSARYDFVEEARSDLGISFEQP
jgi:hypothetical protein